MITSGVGLRAHRAVEAAVDGVEIDLIRVRGRVRAEALELGFGLGSDSGPGLK